MGWLMAAAWLGLTGCETPAWRLEEAPVPAEAAQARVGWDTFDDELLSAAIFAETNRIRGEHGRRRLHSYPRLRGAADIQAFTNAFTGQATHGNPLAGRANPWDRVRAEGIAPGLVLENVAITLARLPESGGAVRIVVQTDGTRSRRDDATGDELPWPTYAELAARIVRQWMDSPAHRANLLSEEVRYLACGTVLARSPLGGEVVHAIQVFMNKFEK